MLSENKCLKNTVLHTAHRSLQQTRVLSGVYQRAEIWQDKILTCFNPTVTWIFFSLKFHNANDDREYLIVKLNWSGVGKIYSLLYKK
jgi:hypothetical protein